MNKECFIEPWKIDSYGARVLQQTLGKRLHRGDSPFRFELFHKLGDL